MNFDSTQRLNWIDVAKGIGISLVVAGHIATHSYTPHALAFRSIITLYQMPLFFILSGYLFKMKRDSDFIRHKFLTLMVPYFIYILGIMLCVETANIIMYDFDMKAFAVRMAKALHGGRHLTGYMGTAWFMSTLFFAQAAYNFLVRRTPYDTRLTLTIMALGAIGIAVAAVFPGFHLPFALSIVPLAIVFFAIGHYLRHHELNWAYVSATAAFIIAVCGFSSMMGVTFRMDMKNSVFGPAILGTALALALSWFVMNFYRFAGRFTYSQTVFGTLGKASLVILCLHQLIHLGLRDAGIENAIILFLMSIAIPYTVYLMAKRTLWSRRLLLGQDWR